MRRAISRPKIVGLRVLLDAGGAEDGVVGCGNVKVRGEVESDSVEDIVDISGCGRMPDNEGDDEEDGEEAEEKEGDGDGEAEEWGDEEDDEDEVEDDKIGG